MERSALPPTGDDEYYVFELVGLERRRGDGPSPRNGRHGHAGCRQRRARARRRPGAADGRGVHPRASISRPDVSLSPPASRTPWTEPFAARRLHTGSARLRLAHRAAPGGDGRRLGARPAALLVPRHDAVAERPDRRRALRRRRGDGAPRRRRRGRARRRLRRTARASRDRVDAAGAPAHAGRRRGARARGAADAALGALRGLRRADRGASLHRLALDRPVRPVERRSAGDGAHRRDRAPAAGRAQRGVGRGRVVLRRARRRSRVPAFHPARRVPRLARCPRCCCRATTRGSIAGGRRTCGEEPGRPPHRRPAERLAGHDRLARHDPRRDRDRARDQDLGREPVPDPVELDGADAALRAPRPRLRGALLRPRARLPVLLPLLGAEARARSSCSRRRRSPR